MKQVKAKILKNYPVAKNYFKAIILAPQIAKIAQPGQFMNIKVGPGIEPLLRRPISIHKAGRHVEFLYEVVGEGTKILSRRKPGEMLDVIGPLGNGFNSSRFTVHGSQIIVAGGMGVAPLLFLAEKLVHGSRFTVHRKPIVVIGARTKNQILCEKEFKKLDCDVKIATDDGSRGFKGRVTDLLKIILLSTVNCQPLTIYACGPKPMLKEISRISREYKIPAQISLEEHMACGIGACLGCVVNAKDGYRRVCKDGPVFDAEEIIW